MKKLIVILTIFIACTYSVVVTATKITSCKTEQCINYFNKFNLSAKRGHPVAMATLGQFYYFGYGTEKNEALALKFLKKSARHGNLAANYKAGLLYLNSEKYQDINKGLEYLQKAASRNYKNATFILGIFYLSKKLEHYNIALADKYLAQAYKQKHHEMPSVIDYINEMMAVNQARFPLLHQAIISSPLVINNNAKSAWPHDNIEVISIISPPMESIFDDLLISFRNQRASIGSRFKGKTCRQNVSCLNIDNFQEAVDWLRMMQVNQH